MSRARALSQKTISLDLYKALDGKYCQRKTGMLEKKGMNAPPRPKHSYDRGHYFVPKRSVIPYRFRQSGIEENTVKG
jgi:hypothetical protein